MVGVHLIKLKPDGSDRLRDDPKCKITIGKGVTAAITLAPPNDLLGLVIAEGVEDALTAHEATGLGAWAAGGAWRMSTLDAVSGSTSHSFSGRMTARAAFELGGNVN